MERKAIKHFATLCAKGVNDPKTTKPHQLPIYATAGFEFETSIESINSFLHQPGTHVYSRYGNPTVEAVAQKIADLEAFGTGKEAYGLLTSSGQSAVHLVIQSLLKPGDVIITQGNLYGGTTELFKKVFGQSKIDIQFVDFSSKEAIIAMLQKYAQNKVIYIETPANPTLSCIDIQMVSDVAKTYGVLLIVDNTFCTPYIQRPLSLGADLVIHSTTKFLHGHGASMGGVVVGMDKELMKGKIWEFYKLIGCNASPFEAWLIYLGLKTLSIRMKTQSANALEIAKYLESHSKISTVNYPGLTSHRDHSLACRQMNGFGALISFDIKGTYEDAITLMDALELCAMVPTLGETDTMILHPASSSHVKIDKDIRMQYGITDTLIRLSVGLESPEDIIGDIDCALTKIQV